PRPWKVAVGILGGRARGRGLRARVGARQARQASFGRHRDGRERAGTHRGLAGEGGADRGGVGEEKGAAGEEGGPAAEERGRSAKEGETGRTAASGQIRRPPRRRG